MVAERVAIIGASGRSGAALARALPSLHKLPPGVILTTVGDAEAMEELFVSFSLAMITGVLCIYIVLVLWGRQLAVSTHDSTA
jgi:multidrug efflux pump subunit AcrB